MNIVPSVSNSITVRLELPARATAVSELTTSIEASGGLVTGLDVTASGPRVLQVDVTIATRGTEHVDEIVAAMRAVAGGCLEAAAMFTSGFGLARAKVVAAAVRAAAMVPQTTSTV